MNTAGGPGGMSDEDFARMMAALSQQFGPKASPFNMWGDQSAPYSGPSILPKIKDDTEFHRLPGGRADEMSPLRAAMPSTTSAMGPGLMAPWLPWIDEEQERRMRYSYE